MAEHTVVPDFFQKNRSKIEKVFGNFSQPVTFVRELAGGETEEVELTGIVSRRNPVSFENFGNYDVQIQILERDAPADLDLNDTIRVEYSEQEFTVDEIKEDIVTIELQCSKVAG